MKNKAGITIGVLFVVSVFVFSMYVASAAKDMPDTVILKLEGAKMGPVKFPHSTHVEKTKIDCAVCHHKDKDPKEPQPCRTCHSLSETKDNAPIARDAFHKRCQTCHKESVAKGVSAPTKCNECHKK